MSLYSYTRSRATGNTAPVGVDTAADQLNRNGFLNNFVLQKNKPLMLAETGASTDSNLPKETPILASVNDEQTEAAVKKSWMDSIISAANSTPLFKAAVWFEEIKPENIPAGRVMRDFRITSKNSLTKVFLDCIRTLQRRSVFVDSLDRKKAYLCTGDINF